MRKKKIWPYLRVMRLDHYHKNIIVLAGMMVFFKFHKAIINFPLLIRLFGAILIVCLAASFNYIINQLTDSKSDRFHPQKKFRPVSSQNINLYALLAIGSIILTASLFLSYFFYNQYFLVVLIFFFLFSLLYNLPPFRFKDIAFLDVATESINNPLRFLLGWFATGAHFFPPSSILVSIWCFGGFLMTAKRYAEFRFLTNGKNRVGYRKAYQVYTREKLSSFMVFWLVMFNFSFGIFIIRVEPTTLVTFPFLALFLTWYWWLSQKSDSIIKEPERIFEERGFFIYSVFFLILFCVIFLFGSKIPFIKVIHYRYIFPK